LRKCQRRYSLLFNYTRDGFASLSCVLLKSQPEANLSILLIHILRICLNSRCSGKLILTVETGFWCLVVTSTITCEEKIVLSHYKARTLCVHLDKITLTKLQNTKWDARHFMMRIQYFQEFFLSLILGLKRTKKKYFNFFSLIKR
jgi:hypothetical protein